MFPAHFTWSGSSITGATRSLIWQLKCVNAMGQTDNRATLQTLITTRQGKRGVYGFVGRDAELNAEKLYTGRSFPTYGLKASPLANYTYRVKSHTIGEHNKAVEAFRQWFGQEMQQGRKGNHSPAFKEVDRLAEKLLQGKRIVLTCFCPKHLPCHARDVLEPAIVDRALEKQQNNQQSESAFQTMKKQNKLIIYSDGASRANPGQAGAGVVIQDAEGRVLEKLYQYLGDNLTNNAAEYEAATLGLERAAALGADAVILRADSQLMIKQLCGEYRVKSEELKPLYHRISRLLNSFDQVTFEHIPRTRNAEADALANKAIDESLSLEDVDRQNLPIREIVINDRISLVAGKAAQQELEHSAQSRRSFSRQRQLTRQRQRSQRLEL